MTVAQLRREMSSDEFNRWGIYFAKQAQQMELERLKAGGKK